MASLTSKTLAWECYAHPAEFGGKPCGHLNQPQKPWGPLGVECCEKCGCTRIASEARRRRAAA